MESSFEETNASQKGEASFEERKVAFEQNFAQFRSLNQLMWQIPMIAMTLTGGLWFGVANTPDIEYFGYLLLILAMGANLGLVVVLERIRFVMEMYLVKLREFSPQSFVDAGSSRWLTGSRTVSRVFQLALLGAAVISGVAIYLMHTSPPASEVVADTTVRVICETPGD